MSPTFFFTIEGLFYQHPGEMRRLRELLLSYNQLKDIPEELGRCENLERLELAMNGNLSDLPSEVGLTLTLNP